MLVFFLPGYLALAYMIWTLISLVKNYWVARKIGLPVLISPVNPVSPLWLSTKGFLRPILIRLPFGLGEWSSRTHPGWAFPEGFNTHARFGEAFIMVTPAGNDMVLAEPTAVEAVLRRRNEFTKEASKYGMLDIYGPNLDTVNGRDWDRHRKVTVPSFNEKNSALVWKESAQQSELLLEQWCTKTEVTSTYADIHDAALSVLCGAGFGLSSTLADLDDGKQDDKYATQIQGYRQTLALLLSNLISLIIVSALQRSGVPSWMSWGGMRRTLKAREEFKHLMAQLLAQEKTAFEQGNIDRHNLMSALVRAQEQSKATDIKQTPGTVAAGLSEDEVFGNLFIYNLAGHETTASSIQFALLLLAMNPRWQDWIGEEIDAARQEDASAEWFYETTFPTLPRCLALMYETVRLYGPVPQMPRDTGDASRQLAIGDREYILPPHTNITLNLAALHTHPANWGNDAFEFRPDRWVHEGDAVGKGTTFIEPCPGSFVAWSSGPRVCPGKKISQVEFTRIMFGLFANGTRVHLVQNSGESLPDARNRASRILQSAKVELTLSLAESEQIGLRWVRNHSQMPSS